MLYIVKKIEEDLDYGCEERPEGTPVMAVLTLADPEGKEMVLRHEDTLLYERDINENDRVYLDADGTLQKAIVDEDWTKKCGSREMDTSEFVDKIERMKAGEAVEWKCPFCGGNVTRIKTVETKETGSVVIGCEECDMRIQVGSR